MTRKVPIKSYNGTVALRPDGNPQGKGLNGFLLDWYESEPRGVIVKSQPQILAEFFTSMLVLSAKFKFKPVVGEPYYLYWINDEWSLSLIAPEEWTDERKVSFAGKCVMQSDKTWTFNPGDALVDNERTQNAIRSFYAAFSELFDSDGTIEEILPFYVSKMPYYQRLYASALSRSIAGTVTLGDQAGTPCREWKRALPRWRQALLGHDA